MIINGFWFVLLGLMVRIFSENLDITATTVILSIDKVIMNLKELTWAFDFFKVKKGVLLP